MNQAPCPSPFTRVRKHLIRPALLLAGLIMLTGCISSTGTRTRNRFEIRTKTQVEVRDSRTGETLVLRKLSGRVHEVQLEQDVFFSEYPDTLPTDGEQAIALITDHLLQLPPAPVPRQPEPAPVPVVVPQPAPAVVRPEIPVPVAEPPPIVADLEPVEANPEGKSPLPRPAAPAKPEPVAAQAQATPEPENTNTVELAAVPETPAPAPEAPAPAPETPAPAPETPAPAPEPTEPYQGALKVKRVKDGSLTLSGSKNGLQPGTRFFVRDKPQTLIDPLTGEEHLLSEGDILGLAEVTEISLFGIKGRILSGEAQPGNRLELKK